MAHHTNSGTRLLIPSAQISKDFQGSDNPIPLSPQWLLSKPGESKPGTGTTENHVIQPFGSRTETSKASRNEDDVHDTHKRKDVFRPSMVDPESGRRDGWRDEERDTKYSIRKDRWRAGDKELGDSRRLDRWNSSEARRGSSDRWNDSANRETNYEQRRESKWNTRWGPDDKESEGLRHEKFGDSGKDGDVHLDKSLSHISNHGKDEKEGDHYRLWRPNSLQGRGRVEASHHQNITPNKQVSGYSYGRGRVENSPPVFTLGRGRVGSGGSSLNSISSHSQYPGTAIDKVDNGQGELGLFSYSRTKLLDVYRVTDLQTARTLVPDFVQVPYLTQDEPSEPLAYCAPTSEELVVLKGIDQGEIIGSSAPQVQKDGRNSTDFSNSRRMKFGSPPLQDSGEDEVSNVVADELPSNKESTSDINSTGHPGARHQSTALGEQSNTFLHDSRDLPGDLRLRNSDMGWSQHSKDHHNQWDSNIGYASDKKEIAKWPTSEDPIVKRQLSGLDRELETRRVPQTSPEDLSLLYKDPQGQIQGPFKGIDIIGWFEAGYFGIDLPVRLESAPADSPWLSLGDTMPHLRAKARPPPGFTAPKPNDCADAPGWQNSSSFTNIHSGFSEVDIMRGDSRNRQSGATDAENRFLESLMSNNKSSPSVESLALSEGLQGLVNPGNLGSVADGGNNLYMLAQRMALERQRSLPTPYQYWPGRDAATLPPKPDIPDAPPHSKLLPSVSDNSHQPQSQNADLMSIFQGLSDRSSVGLNSGVPGWPNYPVQGGLDPLQNKIDLNYDQKFPQIPFGIQQRLQTQNQLSLSNLLTQAVDNTPNILTTEKLLSSGLSQDPQLLNMLQQQYLLQLHSQAAAPAQQMSLLDKFLMLKKQEEQQQLLWQQKQQQLLSQVLQEPKSHQHIGDLSYGHLQGGGIPLGNFPVDRSHLQPMQDGFPTSSQTQIPITQDQVNINSFNLPSNVFEDTSYSVGTETSAVNLQHQFVDGSVPESRGSTLPVQIDEFCRKEFLPSSMSAESSRLPEDKSNEESQIISLSVSECVAKPLGQVIDTCIGDDVVVAPTSDFDDHFVPEECVSPVVTLSSARSQVVELLPASDLRKDIKIQPDSVPEEQLVRRDKSNFEPSVVDTRNDEAHEPKKASEKKSKKHKSSKSQSSEQPKGSVKNLAFEQSKQPGVENLNISCVESGNETNLQQTRGEGNQSAAAARKVADNQERNGMSANLPGCVTETAVSSASRQNTELQVGRAWKPAPGFKPKSLLEIQQEEQRKAQTEILVSEVATSVNSMTLSTPWVGVVAHPDSVKVSSESYSESGNPDFFSKTETSQNLKNKKSPLHDLLAEEVLKKSSERDAVVTESMSSSQNIAVHSESLDDDNFIEAKDTKRSRKKSAKSKGSGVKTTMPVTSSEVLSGSSPIEKGKSSRPVQQEREVLPAIPTGPSLGDFVVWKGEQVSTSPSPAWSTDSARVSKPTALRDILKEQEKKEKKASSAVPVIQQSTPQKSQPSQNSRSGVSSWSNSASSPPKAASVIRINTPTVSQSKYKGDDDLFWGPIEQSKQENKHSDFPQLASQGTWGSKNVSIKGNSPGSLTRQKSTSGKSTERTLSSSPASSQSLLKLKKDALTKHSEAMDFRDWCENECIRLIGTKDTSFLEFCLKQSRSEAEMLLIENLGSYDPDHEFIDKFLNYKELLPSDVLEIAFQSQNHPKTAGIGAGDMNSGNGDVQDLDLEGFSKGGGKKKGKKGKKISSAVLGFNVVSNRIMMGEIQTVED